MVVLSFHFNHLFRLLFWFLSYPCSLPLFSDDRNSRGRVSEACWVGAAGNTPPSACAPVGGPAPTAHPPEAREPPQHASAPQSPGPGCFLNALVLMVSSNSGKQVHWQVRLCFTESDTGEQQGPLPNFAVKEAEGNVTTSTSSVTPPPPRVHPQTTCLLVSWETRAVQVQFQLSGLGGLFAARKGNFALQGRRFLSRKCVRVIYLSVIDLILYFQSEEMKKKKE